MAGKLLSLIAVGLFGAALAAPDNGAGCREFVSPTWRDEAGVYYPESPLPANDLSFLFQDPCSSEPTTMWCPGLNIDIRRCGGPDTNNRAAKVLQIQGFSTYTSGSLCYNGKTWFAMTFRGATPHTRVTKDINVALSTWNFDMLLTPVAGDAHPPIDHQGILTNVKAVPETVFVNTVQATCLA